MSRPKSSTGVQAIVERLTGLVPCPKYLRNSANKYLDSNLFPTSHHTELGRSEKLQTNEAKTLLCNALTLDEAFRSDTKKVAKIIQGELSEQELHQWLQEAQTDIERRFDTYAYWKEHFSALKSTLTAHAVDLKTQRLDEALRKAPKTNPSQTPRPFALRAIQNLEAIEERARRGRLSADEYTEQADAYLALGDLCKASEKACEAIEVCPDHAKAWFIRVIAALKQRNTAIRAMQKQEMIAYEFADPMSSQERQALELADEHAGHAAIFHEDLAKIVPKALLNWPRANRWNVEHVTEYEFIRNLFIDQAFNTVLKWQEAHSNPLILKLVKASASSAQNNALHIDEPPLTADEMTLLDRLVAERQKTRYTFFITFDPLRLKKDFKLLHLQWALGMGSYKDHWEDWSENAEKSIPRYFSESILKDPTLSRLWQEHQARNFGSSAIPEFLERWRTKSLRSHTSDITAILMDQYSQQFHTSFMACDYSNSFELANAAVEMLSSNGSIRSNAGHPEFELVSHNAQSETYWRYLGTLSVVESSREGKQLTRKMSELLLQAPHLLRSFRETDEWEWTETEFYEEGGGTEYRTVPYDIDLRSKQVWEEALLAQILVSPQKDQEPLQEALIKLREWQP